MRSKIIMNIFGKPSKTNIPNLKPLKNILGSFWVSFNFLFMHPKWKPPKYSKTTQCSPLRHGKNFLLGKSGYNDMVILY